MAARVTRWGRVDDLLLHRILRYLRAHLRYGLLFVGKPSELRSLVSRLYVDAGHANDAASARSTSGVYFELGGDGLTTVLPLEFNSKGQEFTARSTPETEMGALDYGVHTTGIPVAATWAELSDTTFALGVHEDCAPVIAAVTRLPTEQERADFHLRSP